MSGPVPRVHHSAICTRDLEAGLRFWRDGLGLQVMMDEKFEGDWTTLFDASGNRLHSIFLGDPSNADAGVVELVEFPDGIDDGPGARPPAVGFFLLSLYVDVDEVLARLASLGLGGEPRRISVPGPRGETQMAVVRDPDGVLVELIGLPKG